MAAPAIRAQESPPGGDRIREFQQALAALPATASATERAEAHNSLGLQFWMRSRFDSALVHLRQARVHWAQANDAQGLARAFNNIGVTYYQSGHYEPALEAFAESLQLRRQLGEARGLTLVLSNLGNTLRDLELYDRALPALQEAVALSAEVEEAHVRGYALHNLGLLQMAMGDLAAARVSLESSIREYHGDSEPADGRRAASSGWALNAVHLGLLHVLEGRIDEGIALLEEVRGAAQEERLARREAMTLLHLGRAWRAKGDTRRAAALLEQGLAIAQAGEQRTLALDMLAQLADVYQAQGETMLALQRLRSQQALRDSVFSQHALQRIASAEARAELDLQEETNRRLLQEQRVRDALIERQRLIGALGAALLIMSLVLVGVLVRFNRTGRERERLLSHANTALTTANQELRAALSEVRTLKGLIPICASCKKVRLDEGYWEAVETYISHRSDAHFSHSICTDCGPAMYGSDWRGEPAGPGPAASGEHGDGPGPG